LKPKLPCSTSVWFHLVAMFVTGGTTVRCRMLTHHGRATLAGSCPLRPPTARAAGAIICLMVPSRMLALECVQGVVQEPQPAPSLGIQSRRTAKF
jgi:hypothetical protein